MSNIDQILKKYSDFIGTGTRQKEYLYYPSSLLSLNLAIGTIKGIQGGNIVQFIADAKAGKTTLALDIISCAQKMNRLCSFLDFERTYSPAYASALGVDNDKLLLIKAPYAETGLEIAEQLLNSGVQVLVIDSVPAAVPGSEEDKTMTLVEKMASSAGLWTRFLKRIIPIADDTDAIVILINQHRANLSQFARTDKKPYGARFIQYASSLTLQLERTKNEKGKSDVSITITKNKQAPEGNKTDVVLQHGRGFRADLDVIKLAIAEGIIEQKGSWFTYKDIKVQGDDNAALKLPIDELRKQLEASFT